MTYGEIAVGAEHMQTGKMCFVAEQSSTDNDMLRLRMYNMDVDYLHKHPSQKKHPEKHSHRDIIVRNAINKAFSVNPNRKIRYETRAPHSP